MTSRHSAILFSLRASCDAIHAGALRAMSAIGAAKALGLETPVQARLQTQNPAHANLFCQWSRLERIDGVTLKFSAAFVEHAVSGRRTALVAPPSRGGSEWGWRTPR